MNLTDAVTGLKIYDEVDQRMAQLWGDLDKAIIGPRTDIRAKILPNIVIEEVSLQQDGRIYRIDIPQVMEKVKLSGEASIGEVSMNEYANSE